MLLKTLILFLFLKGVASATQCNDPLQCYLNSLVFKVPDSCFTISGTDICLSNFACYGIYLSGLPSSYITPTTLSIGADGIGTYCSGSYKVGRLKKGSIKASITQMNTTVDLFVGKENDLPVSTDFSSCNITSMEVDISFISPAIDSQLEEAVVKLFEQILCVNLKEFVAVNVTNYIVNTLDPKLVNIISSKPSAIQTYPSRYTVWSDSFLSRLRDFAGNFDGSANLKGLILCMLTSMEEDVYYSAQEKFNHGLHSLLVSSTSANENMDGSRSDEYVDAMNANEFENNDEKLNIDVTPFLSSLNAATASSSSPSFNFTLLPGYDTALNVTGFHISGWRTLNALELLMPVDYSNATLHSEIGFDELSFELNLKLSITNSTDPKSGSYVEKLKLTLTMHNVSFLLDLVLPIDEFLLKSYYMDQLSTIGCWLSAIDNSVSISNMQLHMNITTFALTQVRGSAGNVESDIVTLIDNTLLLIIQQPLGFGKLTSELINGIVQGPMRSALNNRITNWITTSKAASPCLSHYPYNDKTDYVAWMNSTLLNGFDYIVNDLIGVQGTNQFFTCATGGTGSIALNTTRVNIELGGLNSFYALDILAPVTNNASKIFDITNLIGMGYCPANGMSSSACNPLKLTITSLPSAAKTMTIVVDKSAPPSSMNAVATRRRAQAAALSRSSSSTTATLANHTAMVTAATSTSGMVHHTESRKLSNAFVQALSAVDISISLANFSIYLDTKFQVDKNVLRDMQYGMITTKGCVATSFETLATEEFAMSIAAASLTYSGGNKARNITRLVNNLLSFITRQQQIDKKNADIAVSLSNAEAVCQSGGVTPDSTDDNGSNTVDDDTDDDGDSLAMDWQWEIVLVGIGCMMSLILLLWAYHHWGRSDKKIKLNGSSGGADEEEELSLWHRWDYTNALVFHPLVPTWIQVLVPLAILGNIAIFLDSNISPDAVSVMVKLTMGSKVFDLGSIFDFGLGSTVKDMWNASVYPLAILILFFSGAWPYIKLVAMLVCWVTPPKLLPINRRETILVVLDILGKWSLIDFFVMILMLCAFYYNIYIGQLITVNVTVEPKWGFYSFLLATMMSLGIGHIMLACHRLIVEPKVLSIPDDFLTRESLSSMTYQLELDSKETAYWLPNKRNETTIVRTTGGGGSSSSNTSSNRNSLMSNTAYNALLAPVGVVENSNYSNGSSGRYDSMKSLLVAAEATGGGAMTSQLPPTVPAGIIVDANSIVVATTRSSEEAEDNDTERGDCSGRGVRYGAAYSKLSNVDLSSPTTGEQQQQQQDNAEDVINSRSSTMMIRVTTLGKLFVVFAIIVTACFVSAGTFVDSMIFEFKGLVGLMLKDEAEVSYSFVSVGTSVPEHSGIPNDFAIRWMQASFFLFGQAMPFALLLSMLILWIIPLTIGRQRQLMVLAEVLNAWSALDVFCIAIAASLLEIQQFAAFIVGDSCDGINVFLEMFMDPILGGDDVCFDVVAKLGNNSWIMFVAASLLIVVALPLLQICNAAIHLRLRIVDQQSLILQHFHLRAAAEASGDAGDGDDIQYNNNDPNDNNEEEDIKTGCLPGGMKIFCGIGSGGNSMAGSSRSSSKDYAALLNNKDAVEPLLIQDDATVTATGSSAATLSTNTGSDPAASHTAATTTGVTTTSVPTTTNIGAANANSRSTTPPPLMMPAGSAPLNDSILVTMSEGDNMLHFHSLAALKKNTSYSSLAAVSQLSGMAPSVPIRQPPPYSRDNSRNNSGWNTPTGRTAAAGGAGRNSVDSSPDQQVEEWKQYPLNDEQQQSQRDSLQLQQPPYDDIDEEVADQQRLQEEATFWSRCTLRNFLLSILLGLNRIHMIRITYAPTAEYGHFSPHSIERIKAKASVL